MNKKITDNQKDGSVTNQNTGEESPTETNLRRRLQDNIESKNPSRNLNLDRRLQNNERRRNDDPEYNGPSRRLTIDRRMKSTDRRKSKKEDKTIY